MSKHFQLGKYLALAIMVFLVFTWGSSFILMKKSLEYFPSDVVAAWRMFSAFVVLFIPAIIYLFRLKLKTILLLTLSGIIGNAVPAFLFAQAQTGIESYVAGILNSTTALFTLIVGLVFFGYKAKWLSVGGVITGIAGVVGLLAVAGGKPINFNLNFGSYIIVATIMYAININLIKRWLNDIPTLPMVSIAFFIPGLFAIFYLTSQTEMVSQILYHPELRPGLLYMSILGLFGSAIALLLYYHLIKMSDILFAASVTYLMPVVSTLWGLGDGETLGLIHIAFIIIILAGVFMVNYHDLMGKIKNRHGKNPTGLVR
ncbi:MAG: EamA family transporter [Bacteroidetes bacterium HGW-Bacteroidetes-6]|jgi:drug/metabolite transporter (DMT)-like permease|nr:MAG: EamA family transporter [Bacteroidetes bacterium HGW-Bacteroidetes-6]